MKVDILGRVGKPKTPEKYETVEITIRLIKAVAGLLFAIAAAAIGLAVVWLVRGA